MFQVRPYTYGGQTYSESFRNASFFLNESHIIGSETSLLNDLVVPYSHRVPNKEKIISNKNLISDYSLGDIFSDEESTETNSGVSKTIQVTSTVNPSSNSSSTSKQVSEWGFTAVDQQNTTNIILNKDLITDSSFSGIFSSDEESTETNYDIPNVLQVDTSTIPSSSSTSTSKDVSNVAVELQNTTDFGYLLEELFAYEDPPLTHSDVANTPQNTFTSLNTSSTPEDAPNIDSSTVDQQNKTIVRKDMSSVDQIENSNNSTSNVKDTSDTSVEINEISHENGKILSNETPKESVKEMELLNYPLQVS